MKIHIKLNKRKRMQTAKGSPIVVYVTSNYGEREWSTGHFAKKTEWNERLVLPSSKHPDYYLLLDYIELLKGRISNVLRRTERESIPLDSIKSLLFNKEYSIFYDAVIDLIGENYTDTKYAAIVSFNKVFPSLDFKEITKSSVEKYIKLRLDAGAKAAGVDSYVRSLRSLWNQLSTQPNPFSRHKIEIPDKVNAVSTIEDVEKLHKANFTSRKNTISGAHHYRNYWLLMFYLGGIDPEVLAKVRYDKNVVNGRLNFNRDKGQSKKGCSNVIPKQALDILKQYDCKPYLVPIFKSSNYKEFINNFTTRFKEYVQDLDLTVPPRAKSARYTFIDRAQQLLIDERITAQIVGHKRKTTTSLYSNDFPKEVQDAAHLQIIEITEK